ncbi:MAG TPA: tetraacyldisaccharide 4'-kinase [Gemmatimonadales bacterium]|nr:tetraacyldisaccharide 4'-kinase [Gemmatimonadales bacterium]
MKRRRGDRHRVMRWLWTSRRFDARLTRLSLLPAAMLWRASTAARTLAYRRGWLPTRDLPLPAVAVGNLTVGGSGKASLATWVARYYVAQGLVPGILVPAHGEQARVHGHGAPGALVIADDDLARGAERARAAGAQVLVLDDAFQRLDVRRDYNIAVVSAETSRAVEWPLPAGPWREGWDALARADALVVTRKRATGAAALELAERLRPLVQGPVAVVSLGLRELEGLVSGRRVPAGTLAGKRVVAASALADPDAFVAQVKATGAAVQVAAAWKDPRDFAPEDVAWLARATRKSDHVVITEKDAVKLRDRWPNNTPEPYVAVLELDWETGGEAIVAGLDAVVTPVERF